MSLSEFMAILVICCTVIGSIGIICYSTWKLLTDKMFLIFLDSVLKTRKDVTEYE